MQVFTLLFLHLKMKKDLDFFKCGQGKNRFFSWYDHETESTLESSKLCDDKLSPVLSFIFIFKQKILYFKKKKDSFSKIR